MWIIIGIVAGFIIFGIGFSIGNTKVSESPKSPTGSFYDTYHQDNLENTHLKNVIAGLENRIRHLSFYYPEQYCQFHRIDPCYVKSPSDIDKLVGRINEGIKPLEKLRKDVKDGKF